MRYKGYKVETSEREIPKPTNIQTNGKYVIAHGTEWSGEDVDKKIAYLSRSGNYLVVIDNSKVTTTNKPENKNINDFVAQLIKEGFSFKQAIFNSNGTVTTEVWELDA